MPTSLLCPFSIPPCILPYFLPSSVISFLPFLSPSLPLSFSPTSFPSFFPRSLLALSSRLLAISHFQRRVLARCSCCVCALPLNTCACVCVCVCACVCVCVCALKHDLVARRNVFKTLTSISTACHRNCHIRKRDDQASACVCVCVCVCVRVCQSGVHTHTYKAGLSTRRSCSLNEVLFLQDLKPL